MKKFLSILTALFLMSLFFVVNSMFIGCKKNVGVITSIVRYDVSGYVSDNESAKIAGATVSLDGKAVSTTDSQGKYTISKILPGSYQIEVVKDGYTKGHFTVSVTSDGTVTSLITLKKLAPAVTISVSGGTVAGTGSSGGTSAALTIPAGTLSSSVQISVTTLVGNESPNIGQIAGKAPGVIVSLDSSDPNITFPNGITLTFSLPFTHKPGDGVQIVSYNEVTNHWDNFPNAIVSNDGKTASLTIYHFSLWGAIVNASFVQQDDVANTPVVIPYASSFEWQSMIDFREGFPADLEPSFFYSIVESETNLRFSTYKVASVVSPIGNRTNSLVISPSSASNPEGFGGLPNRDWELVRYSYLVIGTTSFEVYDIQSLQYTTLHIRSWYEMPSYVWLWRPSDTFSIPANSGVTHTKVDQVSTLVIGQQHQGGSGN